MSAAGRLWRRAPAWRFALVSAIAFTGLAIMFPPALPPLHWPDRSAHRGASAGASFHPQKDTTTDDPSIFQMPVLGPTRSGLIPFAGHTLPLPAGNWQTVIVVSSPGDAQQLLLARIVDHHLTGMTLAIGTGVFGGSSGPIGVPSQCADPNRLAGAIVPALPGQSPIQNECWSIVPLNMKAAASQNGDPVISRALTRLGEFGVAVSDRMLAVQFVRSTDHGWQITVVMVPDKGGTTTALSAWATRYQALLHKGFDGTAQSADLIPEAIDVPG